MGYVFDIQRCSYHDGPGIRTTVFLKGCQLRCAWCHNPESFAVQPQLQYFSERCISCGKCQAVCPNQVHNFEAQLHQVDFTRCKVSGKCTVVCPTGALSLLGKDMSAEEVMQLVLKDKTFYEESDGGITITGGEPTLQPAFLIQLLTLSKDKGLHTCLETNGYIPASVLEAIEPHTDLFLLDYKATDSQVLKSYTGAEGKLWLDTLNYLQDRDKPVILRMPIIPGINDNREHFEKAKLIKERYTVIRKIEIMPYHNIGSGKWSTIGLDYSMSDLPSATPKQTSLWKSFIED